MQTVQYVQYIMQKSCTKLIERGGGSGVQGSQLEVVAVQEGHIQGALEACLQGSSRNPSKESNLDVIWMNKICFLKLTNINWNSKVLC